MDDSPSTEPVAGQDFSLRRIAVAAYGPSTIWSIGAGACLPVIALSARHLGASVGVAALFVGITTVAEFLSAVPAGVLVDRIGERRALALAGLVDAGAALLAHLAPTLWVLGLAMALLGPTGAVFLLARQSYLTAATPPRLRARAMSTLGGVTRIGLFVGPLVGAPLVDRRGPQAAYAVAVVAGVVAASIAWFADDLEGERPGAGSRAPSGVRVGDVVRRHRRVLLTVGLGVLAIGLARSARVVVVPLWAEHVGLTAAQTSVVFGIAALAEVLLFYPAGSVMDRHGRVWVAAPVALGTGLVGLPLTSSLTSVGAVAVLMGVGNGLGSGIVMTLGADAAPAVGRAQFLGVWRLLSLVGHNGASLVVGAVAAVASIGAASVVVGACCLAGGAWLIRWLPEHDPRRGTGAGDARAG